MVNKYELEELVAFLLEQGKEGDYWDFKQEWHNKTSDLIKDIICFANTVHDKDCYLIFGIADDLTITGMRQKRKKQADIIDSISKLMFAGDAYPKIEVTTIILNDEEIDVLTIFNVEKTPIYLKKGYGEMLQGCIYSRVGDKNTENKGNADILDIENLWRKRLGLTKSKLEYIYDHLNNKTEWNEFEESYYNIYNPEYTIEITRDDEDLVPEFYAFALPNPHTSYETLNIKYQQTILESYQVVVLDGGRLSIPVPSWGNVIRDNLRLDKKYSYKYYEKDSNTYKVFSFLFDSQNSEQRFALYHYEDVVLFYESKDERYKFEEYIEKNRKLFEEKYKEENRYFRVHLEHGLDKNVYFERLKTGCVLVKMLAEWRKNKSE